MKKVTVIGGGTGLSVLLRGLKKVKDWDITAVVSVADDGGSSGILREDLGMLPPGDIRSCLLALAGEEEGMQEILAYRFKDGRLSGQNMGNLLIAAMNDIYGSFEEAIEKLSDILKVRGKVVPVSSDNITLCAELENGNIVVGESRISKVSIRESSHISDIFLDTADVVITDSAKKAIKEADLIVIGPGSIYTSIVPNLLVNGVSEVIRSAGAPKVYIANVMTQPGESDGLGLLDHVNILFKLIGPSEIDTVIANDRILGKADVEKYLLDGAVQIIPEPDERDSLSQKCIKLIEGNFIEIRKGYIRHNADAVTKILKGLLSGKE